MIKLLIYILLIYVGYRVIRALMAPKQQGTAVSDAQVKAAVTHRDPVCGTYVAEEDAVIGRHGDERHYFCSRQCLDKFSERLSRTS